jgi:hypothetical protein
MDKHAQQPQIEVKDIDHLGILAGVIDEIGLAEELDRRVGTHPQEHVSSSQAVKAMILNGLVLSPLLSICLGSSSPGRPPSTFSERASNPST